MCAKLKKDLLHYFRPGLVFSVFFSLNLSSVSWSDGHSGQDPRWPTRIPNWKKSRCNKPSGSVAEHLLFLGHFMSLPNASELFWPSRREDLRVAWWTSVLPKGIPCRRQRGVFNQLFYQENQKSSKIPVSAKIILYISWISKWHHKHFWFVVGPANPSVFRPHFDLSCMDSTSWAVTKAQHAPHEPWFFTGLTASVWLSDHGLNSASCMGSWSISFYGMLFDRFTTQLRAS